MRFKLFLSPQTFAFAKREEEFRKVLCSGMYHKMYIVYISYIYLFYLDNVPAEWMLK